MMLANKRLTEKATFNNSADILVWYDTVDTSLKLFHFVKSIKYKVCFLPKIGL